MSLHTANCLALGGFCVFYVGLMGSLLAVNILVDFQTEKRALLLLGAVALVGLAAMLIGRLTKVDDSGDS